MDRYTVQHSYTARRDGQLYGPWVGGETVELSTEDAEWVNRDSPGTLALKLNPAKLIEDTPAEEDQGFAEEDQAEAEDTSGERAKTPKRNRAHKGGANR